MELFQKPGVDAIPKVAETARFAFDLRLFVLTNFKVELATLLKLKMEPMSEFVLVGVFFRGE